VQPVIKNIWDSLVRRHNFHPWDTIITIISLEHAETTGNGILRSRFRHRATFLRKAYSLRGIISTDKKRRSLNYELKRPNTAPLEFSSRLASRTLEDPQDFLFPILRGIIEMKKEEIDRFQESGSLLGSGRATQPRSNNERFDASGESCQICRHEHHSGAQGANQVP